MGLGELVVAKELALLDLFLYYRATIRTTANVGTRRIYEGHYRRTQSHFVDLFDLLILVEDAPLAWIELDVENLLAAFGRAALAC